MQSRKKGHKRFVVRKKVLASKLAKAGEHVLLLEAGPPAYDPWFRNLKLFRNYFKVQNLKARCAISCCTSSHQPLHKFGSTKLKPSRHRDCRLYVPVGYFKTVTRYDWGYRVDAESSGNYVSKSKLKFEKIATSNINLKFTIRRVEWALDYVAARQGFGRQLRHQRATVLARAGEGL